MFHKMEAIYGQKRNESRDESKLAIGRCTKNANIIDWLIDDLIDNSLANFNKKNILSRSLKLNSPSLVSLGSPGENIDRSLNLPPYPVFNLDCIRCQQRRVHWVD